MKSGYDQFFKKAQDVRREPGKPVQKTLRRQSTRKFKKPVDDEERLRQAFGMKPKRTRAPFPFKALAGLAATLFFAGVYVVNPGIYERLASHIEISAFGQAAAASASSKAAGTSAAASAQKANPAAATTSPDPAAGPEAKSAVSNELSQFEKLRERKEELDRREKELSELEEELQRQKVELDKRIQKLQDMRTQISQLLKDRVEVDQKKVSKLVDLYSNMKPKQAADIIGTLNEDLAVEVLSQMKKKNAAEIMNLLTPEKARVLSEKYTGYLHKGEEPKG